MNYIILDLEWNQCHELYYFGFGVESMSYRKRR